MHLPGACRQRILFGESGSPDVLLMLERLSPRQCEKSASMTRRATWSAAEAIPFRLFASGSARCNHHASRSEHHCALKFSSKQQHGFVRCVPVSPHSQFQRHRKLRPSELFPVPHCCAAIAIEIASIARGAGRAAEMIYEVFFAAFCRRTFASEHGTRALEAASSLPSLFVDAAERVVTAILFEPGL